MLISNERLISDYSTLKNIANKELPIRASYALAKNISKIESEIRVYEKERTKLIEKYADKDEEGQVKADEGGQIIFKDPEGWSKDIRELLAIENDIEIHKFPISSLEGYTMSPADLILIEYMIEG
ncbi:DUF1617 family protein [Clostridium polynesiense]|uniref:DUF1617 family protein n=1 Tax=Clostridium polynesiense TaxID=1325933 RepID=UPI00058BC27B|nr:DUF1617 family protein [Clostridium polynesiense]